MPGGYRGEPILQLVEGVPGSRQAAPGRRYGTPNEVKSLRAEARDLKEALAEQMLENRLLKKSMIGHRDGHSLA